MERRLERMNPSSTKCVGGVIQKEIATQSAPSAVQRESQRYLATNLFAREKPVRAEHGLSWAGHLIERGF
jgi:hypothetical protein